MRSKRQIPIRQQPPLSLPAMQVCNGSNQAEDVSGTNFRAIMLATKNEELAEETEKKRRARNIMIHGKVELSEDDDKNFVNNLIKDAAIGLIKIQPVERRIGFIKQDKIRSIHDFPM